MKLIIKKILPILNFVILLICSTLPFIHIKKYESPLDITGVEFVVSLIASFIYIFIIIFKFNRVQKLYTLLLTTTYGCTVYKFLEINILESYDVYVYGVIGLLIVIVSTILYCFKPVFLKSKKVFNYPDLFIFLSSIFALYTFGYIIVTDHANFEPGGYLYMISFVIICIIHYLLNDDKKVQEKSKKHIENPIEVDEEYIIVKYIGKIDKTEKYQNRLGVLISKKEDKSLIIGIHSEYPFSIRIEEWNILNITVSKDEPLEKEKTDEIVDLSLAGIIIKEFGAFAASDHLVDEISKYNNLECKKSYKIEITYTDKTKVQKSIFITKANPDNLLKKYGEKYKFKNE